MPNELGSIWTYFSYISDLKENKAEALLEFLFNQVDFGVVHLDRQVVFQFLGFALISYNNEGSQHLIQPY